MTENNDDYLRIGVIAGTHGLDGKLKVRVITDIPERFSSGNTVFCRDKLGYLEYKVVTFAMQAKGTALLFLEGVDSLERAGHLKGIDVYIRRDVAEKSRKELGPDDFYYYDLIDCSVYWNSRLFGTVIDIIEAGAGEIIIVQDSNGKEHMVPFVDAMVNTDRVSEKRLDIFPAEGIIEI